MSALPEAIQAAAVPASTEAARPETNRHETDYSSDNTAVSAEETEAPRKSFSHEEDKVYAPINTGDAGRLTQLARTFTSRSQADTGLQRLDTIDRLETNDPSFDPASEQFNLVRYLRKMMKLIEQDNIMLKHSGVLMKGVNVSGSGAALNYQGTVDSFLLAPFRLKNAFGHKTHRQILKNINVLLESGELLIVLGRPGAGCSTFLKTMTGESHGLNLDKKSTVTYSGISQKRMMKEFKGEVIYNQEVDKHFPHLTVGQTLEHAAALRAPSQCPADYTRDELAHHLTEVVMAIYGLSHTYNTKVGNDFVRGVSGGERKRVSIAEMALAGSPIAAWDNSTRGLDSASALTFTKSLRNTADIMSSTHAVAIYQASQAIYDLFDKVLVLYEGRQIFFGPASAGKSYFERMGWYFPPRQTTGDCLTSVTNPVERKAREGFEDRVPRTAEEFEAYWERSDEYADLQKAIQEHESESKEHSTQQLQELRAAKHQSQGKHTRHKSPYTASIYRQVRLNLRRSAQRAWNDKASTFTPIISNIIIALIIGSVFYNTPEATTGFTSLGAVLFFAILINALAAISEIASLYAQRPIVEKHKSYAFYHPWTEAMAGILFDMPIKLGLCIAFNIVLYFLSNLRREAGPFFLYLMITYIITLVMVAVFRTMAAITKTVSQAMTLAGILILAIVNYTGYSLPVPYMHPWFSWIRWINPVFYGFEFLVVNQFYGRNFTCSSIIPAYTPLQGDSWICAQTGAVAGQDYVNGEAYIEGAFEYYHSHKWRDFGIIIAFLIAFMTMYFVTVELNSSTTSTAEVLVFRRGHAPKELVQSANGDCDEEKGNPAATREEGSDATAQLDVLEEQTDIFTWHDVVYDIEIKGQPRRLLDHVSGWVKPGTLTALMGSSGAGKTTLLDCLAQRVTMGVITGDMLVNGKPLDAGFQRKTGYVQQQDLHLETATVRESLRFSAMLRQPQTVSKAEKYEYVEIVIKMLGMEDFAEAVVGVPGEGLNVEQRKLLTIGVELAAKPKLLLFLDEPTSGLDSQSSWAICAFLRKLADHGQAVLCTIHQPSAILFEQFDRLLFLKKGGQTVYFGDIGKNSRTLLDYFEREGARKCSDEENPAEYMLEMVNDPSHDWHETWKSSPEFEENEKELTRIHNETPDTTRDANDAAAHAEFAMPFSTQLFAVTYRVAQQYWRMPQYIFAKLMLATASGLFIGFSFYSADVSIQGLQNVLYSLFMVAAIFSTLVQQIQPMFVTQRDLYEVRERPSKAYTWKAFVLANMFIELPYQIISGLLTFACFYFPVVGADQSSERQVLVMLSCIALFMYASSFAHLTIAALPDAQTAGAIVVLLFSMCLIFCGVIQTPTGLPGFWIFMYRVSPLTYWVSAMSSSMLWGRQVTCSAAELSVFNPPSGQTCGAYLADYLSVAPGTLANPDATSNCEYCQLSSASQYLISSGIEWSERWRNFGLIWVYIAFNFGATLFLYWYFRARKMESRAKTKQSTKKEKN